MAGIKAWLQPASAAKWPLESGAEVDAIDFGGNTALMGVCCKNYPKIAELLLSHGANTDLQYSNGGTALMFAAMFALNELITILLANAADKTILDNKGLAIFHLAAKQGNEAGIDILESY